MTDFTGPENLPSAPSFLESEEFQRLRSVVEQLCAASGKPFEQGWQRVVQEYQSWEQSFSGKHTSNLNRKLTFYDILLSTFPTVELRNDPTLLDIILSALRKPGETVTFPEPNGSMTTARVVRREITDRLGVLMTLEKPDGEMLSHEIFD